VGEFASGRHAQRAFAWRLSASQGNKSFLVLFFKKELLVFFVTIV
jgi:hypothetical protein